MARKKDRSVRKANTDMASVRELFQSVVPEARRREIIERIAQIALSDDPVAVEAATLLMSYAFGIPTPELDGADD